MFTDKIFLFKKSVLHWLSEFLFFYPKPIIIEMKLRLFLLIAATTFICNRLTAQVYWQHTDESFFTSSIERNIIPQEYQTFQLTIAAYKTLIHSFAIFTII